MSERFRRELGVQFTFLSDEEGVLLDRLNIRHCCGRGRRDIAFPTGILVDRQGIVRWIYEAEFGHMRMTPQDLFEAMERLTLEEHNRQLRLSRAVGKVVRQVFLMERPDDLALAIDVMQDELRALDLRFSLCGIAIVDAGAGKVRTFSAKESGALAIQEISGGEHPQVRNIIDAWSEQRVHVERFDDGLEARDGDRLSELRWLITVPFRHGVVFTGSADTRAPREDHVVTLGEFADAISVAFQRFVDFRDLQDAQLQLMQSEKMASLGRLVAGVAHELNTPMGAIQSNTQTERATLERIRKSLVERDADDFETVSRAVTVLRELNGVNEAAIRRVSDIVDKLKKFARLDESEWKSVDLAQALDETLALVEHQTKNIEIERSYGDVPPVHCYAGQLNQVFMNLLVNAIQAIDGEGKIRIETAQGGENVVVRVADTGSGIADEDLPRVFDPGFTTKGVGVGTGLGLSISYRIVQNHGGRLTVESEKGKGSVFTVTIPLRTRPPRVDRSPSVEKPTELSAPGSPVSLSTSS